jgi:hypothetical protein
MRAFIVPARRRAQGIEAAETPLDRRATGAHLPTRLVAFFAVTYCVAMKPRW